MSKTRRAYIIAGRVVAPVFFLGLIAYSWITKRKRSRVLVIDDYDRVLLVRGIISSGKWTLPGGGMKRNESGVQSARRELREEVGLDLPESAFEDYGVLQRPEVDIPYTALLYRVRVKKSDTHIVIDRHEIRDAAWFDRTFLPEQIAQEARAAILRISGL